MAGEGFVSQGEVKNYDRKITILVLMTCLVAITGGFVLGYDRGISGGVASMDIFLRDFFPSVYEKQHDMTGHENRYCKYDSQLLTSFTSSLYLAAFVASFCAPATTRVFGRKISMTVGSGVFLIGSILTAAAVNVEMLIIGRILLGIGVGYANQSVPVYLSEMAPAKARRALNMVFQWAINIGILVANLVNYGNNGIDGAYGWRVSLALAAVPAIIMTVSAIFLPDTPNSLIERGHNDKAKNILQKVRGTEDVEEEFLELLEASENSKSIEHMHPWRNILQPRYRPQLIMSIAIPFFQQLTGVNVVMFYAPVLFKTIGMAVYSSLMSAVILGQVNMLATFVFISCDDKLSRRFLFLQGGIQMFICQIIVGVILGQKFGVSGEGTRSKDYFVTILFLICAYVAGFALSWGPLGWVVPSETFPLEIRSAGQSINVSANMFFTFIIAHAFPSMLCHMKFGIFFFFGGFMFLMTLFIYFFLPETMNIPIEEKSMVWKKHWFWERYYRENWKLKGPLPVDFSQQLQWEPSSRLNFTLFCCHPRSENELRVFFLLCGSERERGRIRKMETKEEQQRKSKSKQ